MLNVHVTVRILVAAQVRGMLFLVDMFSLCNLNLSMVDIVRFSPSMVGLCVCRDKVQQGAEPAIAAPYNVTPRPYRNLAC